MKNRGLNKLLALGLIASSSLLFSCAAGGEENSKGSPVYTVNYFDEVGNQVGYAYVPENRAASFRDMNGESYDWLPHSDMEITTPGARFVFDKWIGNYDASTNAKLDPTLDGTPIDLNHIKGDCNLTVTFKEKLFKIGTSFKVAGQTYAESTVNFGESLSYPATNPSESHAEYYNNYAFSGWLLNKDSSSSKHHFTSADSFSYVWKTGGSGYAWGEGAPEESKAIGNSGVIYLDKTLTDHMPLYPTYISDGSKWVSMGNLSGDKLQLGFSSEFATSYKQFEVSLLSTEGFAVHAPINVTYGDEITYTRLTSGVATLLEVFYNSVSIYTYAIPNTSGGVEQISYLLEGTYKDTSTATNKHPSSMENRSLSFALIKNSDGVPVGGKATIQGNCSIKPIISQVA